MSKLPGWNIFGDKSPEDTRRWYDEKSSQWAEDRYNKHGIRAILRNNNRFFRGKNGEEDPCKVYDQADYSLWLALWAYQLSTWKERHAKGVPVVMDRKDFNDCAENGYIYPIVRDFNKGNPIARVEFPCLDKTVATFCNFRYKQSWLDSCDLRKVNENKKGGERG